MSSIGQWLIRAWDHRPAVAAATATAAVLGLAYLLAPPMGTDLSAQVARADFIGWYGARPVDFRWYGGVNQFGYSLVTPAVMSVIGPRWLGVVSALIFTGALTYVLVRTGARRPLIGGAAVAVVAVGNLVSGRITFAAGLAIAAGALAVLARPRCGVAGRVGAAILATLTTVTSPVAGLFLGLAAGAWLLADASWDTARRGIVAPGPRFVDAILLGGGAAAGLVPVALFADPGIQPFTAESMRISVALAVAVAVVVPSIYRAIRVGVGLAIALLLFAYYVPTSIGSNALRLPMLFALPVVVAYSHWRGWALAAAVAGLVWWQSPVVFNDIVQAGSPETRASFFQPLRTELGTLGPLGRIEVVPLRDHWESSFVADTVPLARGWLRQVDAERNPLFYATTPVSVDAYGQWLRANAVSYVAMSPDQPLDVYGRAEATIVNSAPSYLREVWADRDWRLYAVVDPMPFVVGGTLVAATPAAVRVAVPGPGTVTVKVRWSRWLTARGACLTASSDGWTALRVAAAGQYTITSGFKGGGC